MKNRPMLAAAVITCNKENNIGDCLASITDFVNEIVVFDSFSTDATEGICRSNPKVKFFQHPFDERLEENMPIATYLCGSNSYTVTG